MYNINKVFKDAFLDKSSVMLLYGSRGSGKSTFAAQKVVFRILNELNHKILVVMKYKVNLRNAVFSEIKKVIYQNKLEKYFEFSISPMEIRCLLNNNQIIFTGLDDPEKLKSIEGVTGAWIEEFTNFTEQDFIGVQLVIRGFSKNYKQIIATFNPIDARHWINREFFQKKTYQSSIYHSTYKDNPFVNIPEYEKALNQLSGNAQLYQCSALGQWSELTDSIIYTNWNVDMTIHQDLNRYSNLVGGIDFAFNSPTAVVVANYTDNIITVIAEYYRTQLTNTDLIQVMKTKMPTSVMYLADSEDPNRITEMKRAGIKVDGVKKGKNEYSVLYGINWIKSKQIRIHPSCINFIKEIGLYSWKTSPHDAKIIFDEPVKLDDHLMDALRYSMSWFFKSNEAKGAVRLW